MNQIQLPEQLFKEMQTRATEAGYSSVDQYVTEILSEGLLIDLGNLDHLFTPERLAIIDQAVKEAENGQVLTLDELNRRHAERRAAWLQKNQT